MDKFSRRSFVKMAGLVAAAAVMPGFSSDEIKKAEAKEEELTKAEPGTGGDHYDAPQGRQGGESVVYFTRDLSAAGLLKLYEKIAPNITGRVGIKLHTGEPHGPNIIPRPWVKELIAKDLPEAKIVETNTYYQGDRYTTEQHRKTLAINGWDFAPVDIMDESGTAMLPVKGGKWFTEMSVGAHLLELRFAARAHALQGPHDGRLRRLQQEHRHRLCGRPHRQEDDPYGLRIRAVGYE